MYSPRCFIGPFRQTHFSMTSVILRIIFLYPEPWDLLPKGLCCCEKLCVMNLFKYCFIWVPCLCQGCLVDAMLVFFYQLMVLYQIIILFFLFKQVSVRTCFLSTEGKPCGSVLFACKSLQQCLFTVLVTPV